MAETLSMISLISFLAAGVFAILAVILWFVFRIPTVAGELSGRIAKKSIERMRKSNEEAGKNSKGPGKREGMNSTVSLRQAGKTRGEGENEETDLLAESAARAYHSEETEVLSDEKATEVLTAGEAGAERWISAVKIELLEEILFIHTKEVIE